MVTGTVQSTDVILSLNKKQRWLLPATLRHMIKFGYFGSKAKVSLLERHKLKKKANCVSFVCNKGRTPSIQPKQKRYFSFNMEKIDDEISNRERRRPFMKATGSNKTKHINEKGGVITTFTRAGVDKTKAESRDKEPSVESTQPEYRMEVFYPCPKTCSLTFNPKYTDVMIDTNERGKQEVKSMKQQDHSRHRRHHRHRLPLPAWDTWVEQDIGDDVDAMWADMYTEDCRDQITNDLIRDMSQRTEFTPQTADRVQSSLWSRLLHEAEKAEKLFGPKSPRKRSSRNVSETTSNIRNKSHIVYEQQPTDANNTKVVYEDDKVQGWTASRLPYFRVILSTEESTPLNLHNKFNTLYSEANCEPRRFIVNVTDDVRNMVSSYKSTSGDIAFTSYIVFTYDGFYDNGFEAYRVTLNSYLVSNQSVTAAVPFQKFTIDDIIHQMLGIILDMNMENKLDIPEQRSYLIKPDDYISLIRSELKVNVDSFHTFNEISKILLRDKPTKVSNNRLDMFTLDEDFELFCQICYASVNPNQESNETFSSLQECGHVFCDSCWRSHSLAKISEGALNVPCPGYDCDAMVDPITLLSLVNARAVGLLLQRQQEETLETSEDVQWCPNPSCGRVIKVKVNRKSDGVCHDVTCACGTSMCFSCLGDPHWPARCDQAGVYSNLVDDIELPVEADDEPTGEEATTEKPTPKPKKATKTTVMTVEGRLCPKCRRFIDKNGGCPNMVCKCGCVFCWTCMVPSSYPNNSQSPCRPNASLVAALTRTVVVKHIQSVVPQSLDPRPKQPTVVNIKSRKRSSLYQKAKQQRQEGYETNTPLKILDSLAQKMVKAASKDDELLIQLVNLCADSDETCHAPDTGDVSITKKQILKFLRSCDLRRKALHHVTEFTFVLLRDLPSSLDKSRALALANDLSGFCIFIR